MIPSLIERSMRLQRAMRAGDVAVYELLWHTYNRTLDTTGE